MFVWNILHDLRPILYKDVIYVSLFYIIILRLQVYIIAIEKLI